MKQGKSLLLLSVTVLIITLLSACNQNQSKKTAEPGTKYYRNILFSETPWDIERGSRELTLQRLKTLTVTNLSMTMRIVFFPLNT